MSWLVRIRVDGAEYPIESGSLVEVVTPVEDSEGPLECIDMERRLLGGSQLSVGDRPQQVEFELENGTAMAGPFRVLSYDASRLSLAVLAPAGHVTTLGGWH